jgi:hypothetical protein
LRLLQLEFERRQLISFPRYRGWGEVSSWPFAGRDTMRPALIEEDDVLWRANHVFFGPAGFARRGSNRLRKNRGREQGYRPESRECTLPSLCVVFHALKKRFRRAKGDFVLTPVPENTPQNLPEIPIAAIILPTCATLITVMTYANYFVPIILPTCGS